MKKNSKNNNNKNDKLDIPNDASVKEFGQLIDKINQDPDKFIIVSRIILNEHFRYLSDKAIDTYLLLLKDSKEIANKFFAKTFTDYINFLQKEVFDKLECDKENDKKLNNSSRKKIVEKFLKSIENVTNKRKKEIIRKRLISDAHLMMLSDVLISNCHFTINECIIAAGIILTAPMTIETKEQIRHFYKNVGIIN